MFNPIKKIQITNDTNIASYMGIIQKTFLLFLITCITTLLTIKFLPITLFIPTIIVTSILSLLLLFITPIYLSYKQIALPIALLEGLGIGVITKIFESHYSGIGLKTLAATLFSFIIVYGIYSFKLIKVTRNFRKLTLKGLIVALISLMIIISLLFFKLIVLTPLLISIIFGFTLLLGLCSLLIDFDDAFILVENKVHKKEEWGVAVSLLISIILVYESFLRLFGIHISD